MRLLGVEVQRARNRIGILSNLVEAGIDSVDLRAAQLVRISIQEAKTENTKCRRIGVQLLHNQIVVFAGFDACASLDARILSTSNI